MEKIVKIVSISKEYESLEKAGLLRKIFTRIRRGKKELVHPTKLSHRKERLKRLEAALKESRAKKEADPKRKARLARLEAALKESRAKKEAKYKK